MAFFCKLYYVGNCETNCLLKVSESQDIALFVVSGSIKKIFSIDCVKIYFPQSIVNYLFSIMFSIDLKTRFGNLGIGTSASALALASALASALQKSYLYLTHFFLEKIEYHVQYASIFFLVQLVLSYLKICALFNVRVFLFFMHKHAC